MKAEGLARCLKIFGCLKPQLSALSALINMWPIFNAEPRRARDAEKIDICVDYGLRFGDGALGACSKHGSTTASVVKDRNDFSLKFVD